MSSGMLWFRLVLVSLGMDFFFDVEHVLAGCDGFV